VSPGHSRVIPKRPISSFFKVTEVECAALFALLDRTEELVAEQHRPESYNIGIGIGIGIGIDDGAAAGQTVPHLHLHIHLIPGPYR